MAIIISAPHAATRITEPSFRRRIGLDDYQIWKCSDPYTDRLDLFTCAAARLIAKSHRLLCDLNREPTIEAAFRTKDFFGQSVFASGQAWTQADKLAHIKTYWEPYYQKLLTQIQRLARPRECLLVVDLHNTSGDHPLNEHRDYMPSIVLSNFGEADTGKGGFVSLPATALRRLRDSIKKELNLSAEINKIYRGGYETLWVTEMRKRLNRGTRLYAVQIEYNLDLIYNPLSQRLDRLALGRLYSALDRALLDLDSHLNSK